MTKLVIEDVDFGVWEESCTDKVQHLADRICEARIRKMRLPETVVVNFLRSDNSQAIADTYSSGLIVFNTANQHNPWTWDDVEYKLLVLAHELVHVEQYHTGKLRADIRSRQLFWRNSPYRECNYDCRVAYQSDEEAYKRYMQLPWEKEAFARQERVYHLNFALENESNR